MSRRSPALALLLAGACHPLEALPPPPLDGAEGALLAYETADGLAFVQAIEPGATDLPSLVTRGGERLHLAQLACGLGRLGLSPGPQSLRTRVTDPPQVPAPRATLALAVDDPDPAWTPSTDPIWSEALGRLPVPEDNLCDLAVPPYTGDDRIIPVAGPQDILLGDFALDLGDGRVLVAARSYPDFAGTATTGHGVYRYDDDPNGPSMRLWEEVTALGPLLTGARLADGEMWLMGYGALWLGHPDTGFEVVTSTVFDDPLDRAQLATSPDGAHVYVATESRPREDGEDFSAVRRLLTLEGGAWRELRRGVEPARAVRPGVAWAGGDRFVVLGFTPDRAVLEATTSTLAEVVIGGARKRRVQSLRGGGAAVTSDDGGLWVRNDGGWETIRERGFPGLIEYVDRRDGAWALFGWVDRGVGAPLLTDDYGVCHAEVLGVTHPTTVAPVGDGVISLNRAARGGSLRIARLRPGGPVRPPCE